MSPSNLANVAMPPGAKETSHQTMDSPQVPSILVVTSIDDASDTALKRGHALAAALGAELVVLHVIPPHSWVNMLFPREHQMDALAMRQLLLTTIATTQAWCTCLLYTSDAADE